ncbi:MAG: hypothetical protein HZC44_12025 [Geobacter sp.]|nr:hypothetical protein [Geobacter sp.]
MKIDTYVIMLSHVHGIVWLVGTPLVGAPDRRNGRATTRVAPTLGDVVGAFKSITTGQYILGAKMLGWVPLSGRLWQRNYYEHVIRNENALNAIREYIKANPSQWQEDPENPDVIGQPFPSFPG